MSDSVIMFIGQIFNGLKIGSVYSLVALGYTMVYGIIRLINFAHGDFIMVGSYALMLTIPFIIACGLPAWFAVIPAVLVCVAVGIIVERAAYKPVREKGNNMTALITAIAMSLLLENGSQALFGADYQTVPTIVEIPTLVLGKLKIDGATIITVLLGIAIMVALQLFVSLTKQAAFEYGDKNVLINAICPGTIDTPILQDITDEMREQNANSHMIKRLGMPSEIAGMMAYLFDPVDGAFQTGLSFPVDGGWSINGLNY